MNPLTSVILRLALIQGSRDKIIDKLSNKLPAIPRGNGVSLQCALFTADPREATLVDTFTGISSVTMQVRKDNALGDALFDKTVDILDFDDTGLTWAEWDANTNQHLTIALTATETGQAMPSGKDSLAIYIAFEATPTVGDPIFLGSITTTIFEDGIGSSGSPVVGDPTYLTAAESDARYAARGLTSPDMRLDITGLTGGGATNLDGIVTLGLSVPRVFMIVIAGVPKFYQLAAGTAAEASPGIIRPDDYAGGTNEKVFTQIL